MARTVAMTRAIGITRWRDVALAASSTTMICSVAYATDDSGSDEKIGRARILGSRVWGSADVAWRRPRRTRFSIDRWPRWAWSVAMPRGCQPPRQRGVRIGPGASRWCEWDRTTVSGRGGI